MESPQDNNSLKRFQSVLRSVFSAGKLERLKEPHAQTPDTIQKSAQLCGGSHNANKEESQQQSGAVKIIKYKHASVQTDQQVVKSVFCCTDDFNDDVVEVARPKAVLALPPSVAITDDEQQELPKLIGNVSVRRRTSKISQSTDSLTLPATRTRFIKFDRVAVLLDAAANGDIAELKGLLQGDSPLHIDSCTSEGATSLHAAAASQQISAVRYLLSLSPHVNAADAQGNTPLHMAAARGSLPMVQCLVEAGASVEAANAEGKVPGDATPFADIREYLRLVLQRKMVGPKVLAIYDFNRHSVMDGRGDEMSVTKGTELLVVDRGDPDWWLVERASDGKRGFVPRLLLQ